MVLRLDNGKYIEVDVQVMYEKSMGFIQSVHYLQFIVSCFTKYCDFIVTSNKQIIIVFAFKAYFIV